MLKTKLLSIISLIALTAIMLIVGVWAIDNSHKINLSGDIDFTQSTKSFYIKDIRQRDYGDLGQGTTIADFIPGFMDKNFDLNLGEIQAQSSFELLIDVINTTTETLEVSTNSTIDNAEITVEGIIAGDGITPTEINDLTEPSGTIYMTVLLSSPGSVNISGVLIESSEYVQVEYTDFTFNQTSDTTGELVSYTGMDANVVIPSSYSVIEEDGVTKFVEGDDYIVTAIASSRYYTSGAFYQASSTLENVELPSTLETIGDYAFNRCFDLNSVEFPVGLKSIGKSAFESCNKIDSIILPEGLETIGSKAFSLCNEVTSVNIPKSVTSIGDGIFAGCADLNTITVDTANPYFSNDSKGILYNKNKTKLLQCPANISDTTFTISVNVTEIGGGAFNFCRWIQNYVFHSGIISIGEGAFRSCFNVKTFNLSVCTQLKNIGDLAFEGCYGLISLILPDCNTTISGSNTFSNCSKLSNVTINEYIFRNVRNITTSCGGILEVLVTGGIVKVPARLIDELGLTNSYLDNSAYFSKTTTAVDGYYEYTKL